MEIQSVQCPSCGGALDVSGSTTQARCAWCGAALQVSEDASGHPKAVLAGIKSDTSIVALDAMRRRLESERDEQREGMLALDFQYHQCSGRKAIAWMFSLSGGVGALVFFSGVFWDLAIGALTSIALTALVLSLWLSGINRQQEACSETARALATKMSETEARLSKVVAHMDQLGHNLSTDDV